MKCRQTGINAEVYAKHGHGDGQHARRRDRAGGAARRDRLRRMGRRRRGPAPRPATASSSTTTRPACTRTTRSASSASTCDVWKSFTPQQQEAVNSAVKDTFITWSAKWQKQNAEAIEEMQHEARRADPAHAARHPDRVPQGLGRDRRGELGQEPVLQEGATSRSAPTPRRWCRPSASCSRRTPSRPTTTGPRPSRPRRRRKRRRNSRAIGNGGGDAPVFLRRESGRCSHG